ncbi:MAG: TadE/TadG family type IV pilus assembly protein [Nocardioidaceae bacterium]
MRCRRCATSTRGQRGSAVVDFALVLVVLLPLLLGIVHLALVLHVRNTLTAAASQGARYAATIDRSPQAGAARTRERISGALAARFARDVTASEVDDSGVPVVEVRVVAKVPPLGLWGPATTITVSGHAVEEVDP